MAITVDWPSGVFTIQKADTTLVDAGPPEIREFDVNDLRLAMRALEASEDGMPWPVTHFNTGEYTLSGFTYARGFGILAPYTVLFEDLLNDHYTVNLFGANHNIADVKIPNSVSITVQNSAGLIVTTGAVAADDIWGHEQASSLTALNARTDTL